MDWNDMTQEELMDNPDFINEVRFGDFDARSDEEIRDSIFGVRDTYEDEVLDEFQFDDPFDYDPNF